MTEVVHVPLPGREYEVRIGQGVLGQAGTEIAPLLNRPRVVIVADDHVAALHLDTLEAGLRAYERIARLSASLVAPGGILVLCSCSHAADLTQFRAASVRGIGRAGRHAALVHTGFAGPDHPLLPSLAESGYLKALFFRL